MPLLLKKGWNYTGIFISFHLIFIFISDHVCLPTLLSKLKLGCAPYGVCAHTCRSSRASIRSSFVRSLPARRNAHTRPPPTTHTKQNIASIYSTISLSFIHSFALKWSFHRPVGNTHTHRSRFHDPQTRSLPPPPHSHHRHPPLRTHTPVFPRRFFLTEEGSTSF